MSRWSMWIPQDQTGSLWFKWGMNMNVKSSRWCIVQKNAFHDRWTKNCRPKHLMWSEETHPGFRLLQLGATSSATIRRPKADGERRSLCKLQTKIGTFQIWKRKLLAGEFAYYLDHWSESYSWFLCSKYEWAKAEAVANLKVDRWGGK